MSDFKVVQFRRGSTVHHETFIGAPGEITVDTDKWCAVVHDGMTAGGYPLKVEAVQYAHVRYLMYRAASVQQGQASLGFSSPLNQGPDAIAYTHLVKKDYSVSSRTRHQCAFHANFHTRRCQQYFIDGSRHNSIECAV